MAEQKWESWEVHKTKPPYLYFVGRKYPGDTYYREWVTMGNGLPMQFPTELSAQSRADQLNEGEGE